MPFQGLVQKESNAGTEQQSENIETSRFSSTLDHPVQQNINNLHALE